MYQVEIAGDDIKRLQKMLVWTGMIGTKNPEHVHFVSSEKGVFIWTKTPMMEALFKIHGPIGDHGVRKLAWGEWKSFITGVKKDNSVKFKVKKTGVDVQVGTKRYSLVARPIEEEPTIEIVDASEIGEPKLYMNDESMVAIKIGMNVKTAAGFLPPILWKNEAIIMPSIFYTKAVAMRAPGFVGDKSMSQGILRIALDSGGGTTLYQKDNTLMLSAIDFTIKTQTYDSKYSEHDTDCLMGGGTTEFLAEFPCYDKKTEQNAYIRKLNALDVGDAPVTTENASVYVRDNKLVIRIVGSEDVGVLKSDFILALKNMSGIVRAHVIRSADKITGLMLVDELRDKTVCLSGVSNNAL